MIQFVFFLKVVLVAEKSPMLHAWALDTLEAVIKRDQPLRLYNGAFCAGLDILQIFMSVIFPQQTVIQ